MYAIQEGLLVIPDSNWGLKQEAFPRLNFRDEHGV
jgi:hypothetical protein